MAIYCWPLVAACEKMINFMAIYWVSWPSWMKAFIKAFYNKLSQTALVGQATIHNIQCTYVLDSIWNVSLEGSKELDSLKRCR